MRPFLQGLLDRPFVRFVLVGAVNTADYALLFLLLHRVTGYLVAHVVAFAVSLSVSYLLTCRFTFRVRPSWSSFLRFPLSNATSFVVSTAVLAVLVSGLGLPTGPSVVAAFVAPIPVTFLVSRRILQGAQRPAGAATP